MKTSLFIGRWQTPILHDGHRALIETALDEGRHVVVGIRDTRPDSANPFNVDERRAAIYSAFGGAISTIVIPDPDCDLEICYGRDVGYSFRQIRLPENLEAISATALRRRRIVLWLTGNSGAGKTTLAHLLAGPLRAIVLDGDEMRDSISRGVGFSMAERQAHNERVAHLARVLSRQTNVIVALIAPIDKIRLAVDAILGPTWIYVKRALPERDDYPYTPPEHPNLVVDCDTMTPDEAAHHILTELGRCNM